VISLSIRRQLVGALHREVGRARESGNDSALLPLRHLRKERQDTMASEPLGIPRVKVIPTGGKFRWAVRDESGKIIESGTEVYTTDRAALRAGNAAARAVSRRLAAEKADGHQNTERADRRHMRS
jgi:hypothetical protein